MCHRHRLSKSKRRTFDDEDSEDSKMWDQWIGGTMDKLKTQRMRSLVLLSIANTHKKDNSKQNKVEDMAKV